MSNPRINVRTSLLQRISDRQDLIVSSLAKYGGVIILLSFILLVLYYILSGSLVEIFADGFDAKSMISLLLSLFSDLITWIYALFAVSFVPFIAIQSQQASKKSPLPIGRNPFKFIQLFISIIFPALFFAVAWQNFSDGGSGAQLTIDGVNNLLFSVILGILVFGLLTLISRLVSPKQIFFYTTFFASLLFFSLFITYGFNVEIVSYGVLFGILGHMALNSNSLSELGKRISVFDLDQDLADEVEKMRKDENVLAKQRLELDIQLEQQYIDRERKAVEQQQEISKIEYSFYNKKNETNYRVYNKRITLLDDMYEIVAKQLDSNIESQLPGLLDRLKVSAKDFTPEELTALMKKIYSEMDSLLKAIPEGLEEITDEMEKTIKLLDNDTKRLATRKRDKNDDNPRLQEPEQSEFD